MPFEGPYVHRIDPIIVTILGVHLWWYGASYALGFLNAHGCIRRKRRELGLSIRSVYSLSLFLAGGVLLGGRFVEVVFYEWPFYGEHPGLIPAYWLGGMATHGLLLGGLIGIWVFCRLERRRFLSITDALAIPAAVILGLGRIGNFIDGQIVGSVTTAWWGVKFPDAEGFRQPVVLYDGLKNLLIVPLLMAAEGRRLPEGARTGLFLFLYAFARIFVDMFREYPTTLLGWATGQVLNVLLSALGLGVALLSFWKRGEPRKATVLVSPAQDKPQPAGLTWQRLSLAALLLFSLVLPSDWTQDVPSRYGHRHPGLEYSALYPRIDPSPPGIGPKR